MDNTVIIPVSFGIAVETYRQVYKSTTPEQAPVHIHSVDGDDGEAGGYTKVDYNETIDLVKFCILAGAKMLQARNNNLVDEVLRKLN